jgi:UV DNA damage endonuclease
MALDATAKIQVHVGGIYNDKEASIRRFVDRFNKLPYQVRKRLVIENDDRSHTLRDITGIPVLLDSFHHQVNSSGDNLVKAVSLASSTWRQEDRMLMVDYSYQRGDGRIGAHSDTLDIDHFRTFLEITQSYDFDVMLEIKDKERSALKAIEAASNDSRFIVLP